MAEEHGFQAQEGQGGHRLCANNCGFFGSPTTFNLCSKCYRDVHMKQQQDNALAKAALDSTNPTTTTTFPELSVGPSPNPGPSTQSSTTAEVAWSSGVETAVAVSTADVQTGPASTVAAVLYAQPNRCLTCRKRVGLTGFKCRCGLMFCGSHRYPELHGCTFDYKTAGKEAIAKANPLIKAEKLEKI